MRGSEMLRDTAMKTAAPPWNQACALRRKNREAPIVESKPRIGRIALISGIAVQLAANASGNTSPERAPIEMYL